MTKIVKLIILVILLAIFGKYIYQYLKRGGGDLFSLTKKTGSFIKRGVVKSIEAVGIGSTVKNVEAKLTPSPTPAPLSAERSSTLAEPANIPRPPTIAPPSVTPDSSADSSIQTAPQKGYCYVGTDRGYRSCIYVKNPKSCMSEKIFPTKEVCEYPGLRPGIQRSSGWYYFQNGRYQLYTPEPYFNDHYYQSSPQSGHNGSSQSGYNGSSQSGYNGSSQSGYNGSSQSGYSGDQFNFTRFYDMRGAGDKSYNRNYNGTYRDRDDYYNRYGSKTKSMSQYIAKQDRNVIYGGRGRSMPTRGKQNIPPPRLYSS